MQRVARLYVICTLFRYRNQAGTCSARRLWPATAVLSLFTAAIGRIARCIMHDDARTLYLPYALGQERFCSVVNPACTKRGSPLALSCSSLDRSSGSRTAPHTRTRTRASEFIYIYHDNNARSLSLSIIQTRALLQRRQSSRHPTWIYIYLPRRRVSCSSLDRSSSLFLPKINLLYF